MTDKELENWIIKKQDWIDLKCRYFTRDIEAANELKAQAQLNMWLYRENYSRPNNEQSVESWMFFVIKYAYFHILEHLYKKPIYYYPDYNNHELITENTILSSLQAKSDIDDILSQIETKVSKTASKVVKMRAEGFTHKEIGEKLNICTSVSHGNEKKVRKYLSTDGNIVKITRSRGKINKIDPIIAFNDSIEVEYQNSKIASDELKIKASAISRALRYPNYTAGGYSWRRKLINE